MFKIAWGAWNEAPAGFRRVQEGRLTAFVKKELSSSWNGLMLDSGWHGTGSQTAVEGGRGQAFLFTFEGSRALAREYIHGGLRKRFLRRQFATWPPRPVVELVTTDEVRKRGIPTLDVLAVQVRRDRGLFYRGAIVTRYVSGSVDLWTWLKSAEADSERKNDFLISLGRFLRSVHDAGLYHGDLNLRNILVQNRAGKKAEFLLIDLDRSRLGNGPLPMVFARRNLRRFWRSARKLDPTGAAISASDLDLILSAYHGGGCNTVLTRRRNSC